jgi:alkylated DNA repair dioxygenase AlkB
MLHPRSPEHQLAPHVTVREHVLFGNHFLLETRLPAELERLARTRFEELWALHPAEFHHIIQPFTGRSIPLPRWQQAYERDYRYSGNVNRAAPMPRLLIPFLAWARNALDPRLNGLLLNWYDAELNHYIGPHRDSIDGLLPGAPIVTISLGATRLFRLRPLRGKESIDFEAGDGTVFIVPWDTNLHVKHEVPRTRAMKGRRICQQAPESRHEVEMAQA